MILIYNFIPFQIDSRKNDVLIPNFKENRFLFNVVVLIKITKVKRNSNVFHSH